VAKLVEQLLEHLSKSDHQIREELVAKISILASEYANDREYVDYILRLIAMAGDFVAEGVWHKAVRVVTNSEDPSFQEFAAESALEAARSPRTHPSLVKLSSVLLGEFGHLIHSKDGMSALEQCVVLYSKFPTADAPTRCLVFSALCKLALVSPEVKEEVLEIATGLRRNSNSDLQQRAVEFCVLAEEMDNALFADVYQAMPEYPDMESEAASPSGADGDGPDLDGGGFEEGDDDDDDSEDEDLIGFTGAGGTSAGPGREEPEDDLADLMADMSGPTTSAPAPQGGGNDLADLLGGDDLLGAPAPQASASAEPDSSPAVLRAFATACRSPKGVLYEDDKIQIGWMEHQPYADRMGVVGFFFKNKTPGPFSCFTVAIPPAATLSLKLQDMNPNLPAGASANMGVQVRIEEPFPDPPVANISFVMGDGTPVQLALRVPIVVTKFSKGYAVSDAPQFSQMWQQGAASESQQTFTTGRPLEQASLKGLLGALNCSNMESIDPNPQNIVAGAQTTTATGQIWGMVRLECAATKTQFRISTRASNKEYAAGLMNIIAANMKTV